MAKRMVEADNLQRDLRMASRVQESLFPDADFDFIHGVNIPKKGVSGDLYDYVSRDGQIYFCMADVSGKGTDAALVMAKTHSLFRSLSRNMPAVNELAARMNGELVKPPLTECSLPPLSVNMIRKAAPCSAAMPVMSRGCWSMVQVNSHTSKPACSH